jgi:hypothetical protein
VVRLGASPEDAGLAAVADTIRQILGVVALARPIRDDGQVVGELLVADNDKRDLLEEDSCGSAGLVPEIILDVDLDWLRCFDFVAVGSDGVSRADTHAPGMSGVDGRDYPEAT